MSDVVSPMLLLLEEPDCDDVLDWLETLNDVSLDRLLGDDVLTELYELDDSLDDELHSYPFLASITPDLAKEKNIPVNELPVTSPYSDRLLFMLCP